MLAYFEKIKRGVNIMKLTNFMYFKASQLQDKVVTYHICNKRVQIEGQSVLSMLFEIVVADVYHLRKQYQPKVIMDVGANVGVFSIYAAILFPHSKIYAFEPSTDTFILLQKNTKDFKNIHCLNMAMSNHDGVAYLSGKNDPTAFTITGPSSADILQQCSIIALESFLFENAIDYVDMLKLDCEGAEYDIIESNITNISHVVGEYHRLENRKTTDIKDLLEHKGFVIKQWTNSPTDNAGIFWGINKRIR